MSTFENKCAELGRQNGISILAKEMGDHFGGCELRMRHLASVNHLHRPACHGIAVIEGSLGLSHDEVNTRVSAECSFEVSEHWPIHGPILRCAAPWIRGRDVRDPDWHVNSDGSLCYVLDDQWRDAIRYAKEEVPFDELWSYAAFYAINNARWLLFRHLESYRLGIKRWSDHWPAWPHHEQGRRAYRLWRENSK